MLPVPVTSVYVKVLVASGSVVERVPTTALAPAFSAIDDAERATSVGVSLTFVTVIVNAFSVKSPPWSVERTRTLYELLASKLRPAVARSWFPEMLKAALSVLPVPVTSVYVKVLPASGSVVERVPTTALAPAFSAIDVAERAMSVGVSFMFVTVIVNAFSVKSPP